MNVFWDDQNTKGGLVIGHAGKCKPGHKTWVIKDTGWSQFWESERRKESVVLWDNQNTKGDVGDAKEG